MPTLHAIQKTPNPDAIKLIFDGEIHQGVGVSYYHASEAEEGSLARKLLSIPGVASLFVTKNFISVRRAPRVDWEKLTAALRQTISEHFGAAP